MQVTRFVAVGDSFTEGLADGPGVDGHYVGWADRVAHGLAASRPRIEYANLAVRGKLLDEVAATQLVAALAHEPELLTFHAGGNDVLRPATRLADLARRYELAVRRATMGAGTCVVFTMVERNGERRAAAERLAARIAAFNDHVRAVAATHDAVLVDLADVGALRDPRLWHEDRLHLASDGHRRVAAGVLEALGEAHDANWRAPLPPAGPTTPARALARDARWVAQHLLPWVGRRLRGVSSGDGRTAKRPRPARV